MKLTTASVLAFAAASVLANSVPYEGTAVYACDLYERDGGEGLWESSNKCEGAVASSHFKSIAGTSGSMDSHVASNSVQYGLTRSISSTHSTPKPPPTHHRQPHLRLRRPRLPQPPSSQEHEMRGELSRPVAHLESLEKRRGSSVQLDPLENMIPPPIPVPVARRALTRPIPRAFAPFKAIKNAFNRTAQATARGYRKSALTRKKSKEHLITFLDSFTTGVGKRSVDELE